MGVLVPTLVIFFSSSIGNSVFSPAEGTAEQQQIRYMIRQLLSPVLLIGPMFVSKENTSDIVVKPGFLTYFMYLTWRGI